jgi:hypothetical protein
VSLILIYQLNRSRMIQYYSAQVEHAFWVRFGCSSGRDTAHPRQTADRSAQTCSAKRPWGETKTIFVRWKILLLNWRTIRQVVRCWQKGRILFWKSSMKHPARGRVPSGRRVRGETRMGWRWRHMSKFLHAHADSSKSEPRQLGRGWLSSDS